MWLVESKSKEYRDFHMAGELPQKISTRIIPDYANVIENLDEIQIGDVFAKIGSHVMFFQRVYRRREKEAIIIDATRSTGKVSQRQENIGGCDKYCKDIICPDGCVMFRLTAKKLGNDNFFKGKYWN